MIAATSIAASVAEAVGGQAAEVGKSVAAAVFEKLVLPAASREDHVASSDTGDREAVGIGWGYSRVAAVVQANVGRSLDSCLSLSLLTTERSSSLLQRLTTAWCCEESAALFYLPVSSEVS